MSKFKASEHIKLAGYDELFGGKESMTTTDEVDINGNPIGTVVELEFECMTAFKEHPFKVLQNEEMDKLVESIQTNGKIIVPGLVRPLKDQFGNYVPGKYEIISGHRRHAAGKLAGLLTMPVIIRELDDDDAVVAMVDSNIQREDILPSEKAWAYRMKSEALKHRGSNKVHEVRTADEIGEKSGESGRQVQRYIRLTELIPELLTMVDNQKIGLVQGVDLSYIDKSEQKTIYECIDACGVTPNAAQCRTLRVMSSEKGVAERDVYDVLKPIVSSKQAQKSLTIKAKKLKEYFGDDCDTDEIEALIFKLLDEWKNRQ